MGKILGIDYGDARVGLAITDALKITAQPMDTLEIHGDSDFLIQKIEEIMKESKLEAVVIGYPRHLNGDVSETARKIDVVIEKIEALGLEVVKWDERLTTVMAHKTMKELGIKQKDKKIHADRLAAMYILEDYINSL
ncbi:MAG: Holliday junction resolvase RuvX [Clostridia bacterium]|nr:Holliday junction resolvase RuvX [Clostridia bacterium]